MTDKNSVADWDVLPDNNDNIAGIALGEGVMQISGFNDALRTVMAQIKTANFVSASAAAVTDSGFSIVDDGDATKIWKVQVSGLTTATTRTVTVPDASGAMVLDTATQTLTNKTLTTPTLTLKQSATPTPTAEGDTQWDTDDNVLAIGDGAATKLFLPIPASTAAGDIEYFTGAKVKARLAKGSDGDLLTLASGVPSWASPATIVGALTLLSSGTPTASASTYTVTGLSTSYTYFLIYVEGVTLSGTVQPNTTVSSDNGSTFDTAVNAGSTASTMEGVITIHKVGDTAVKTITTLLNTSSTTGVFSTKTGATNAVRFGLSSGTFSGAGTIKIYGVK